MTFAGLYDIWGVRGDKLIKSDKPRKGSPTEGWMCQWGKDRSCDAVIRHFPGRKGYRLLDIREARQFQLPGRQIKVWRGQVRGDRFYPSVDAAIMAWLHTRELD